MSRQTNLCIFRLWHFCPIARGMQARTLASAEHSCYYTFAKPKIDLQKHACFKVILAIKHPINKAIPCINSKVPKQIPDII
jgi:hypothetical protein